MINFTSPVVGSAVNLLTSPTYTLTSDYAPQGHLGRQWAVSALGGTQTGVTIHSISSPFTVTFLRPSILKALGQPGANGVITNIGKNVWELLIRKGATPAANQNDMVNMIRVTFDVKAGTETYDGPEVEAMISCLAGVLAANAAGIALTLRTGIW